MCEPQLTVLLGKGDGTFNAPVVGSSPAHLTANPNLFLNQSPILAVDVNGDGRDDLVFTATGGPELQNVPTCSGKQSGSSNTLVTLPSRGDGTFGPPNLLPTNGFYVLWGVADLNGDGIPDLLFNDDTQLDLGVMLGSKDHGLSSMASVPAPTGACIGIDAAGDFNNDRRADLLLYTVQTLNKGLSLLVMNTGNLTFAPPVTLGPASPLAVADLNADGNLDIVRLLSSPSEFSALLGTGTGSFQAPKVSLVNLVSNDPIAALELNGDGKADLVQAGSAGTRFYLSNGDGTFQLLTGTPGVDPFNLIQNQLYPYSLIADFNADGKSDLAAVVGNTLRVYLNSSTNLGVTAGLNAASFAKGQAVTPGSLATIFGSGFTSPNVSASAASIPLPLGLQNVSVTIGGIPAPLLFVNPTQINLQVPWELTGSTADVVVTANGTLLPPFHASIAPAGPGVFTAQSGTGQAIAINNADGSLAGPSGSIPGVALHPASAGDVLLILCTGLGAVSPNVADGAAASDGVRNSLLSPTVLIGGQPAQVLFSGLAPQFVGVNQINVVVPQGVTGIVPLQIALGGITTSDQVTIAVN